MNSFGVVGFGALNVDKLFKVDRLSHAEEESFVISEEEICGGSAANTIVGLARLGIKCRIYRKNCDGPRGRPAARQTSVKNMSTLTGLFRSRKVTAATLWGL